MSILKANTTGVNAEEGVLGIRQIPILRTTTLFTFTIARLILRLTGYHGSSLRTT